MNKQQQQLSNYSAGRDDVFGDKRMDKRMAECAAPRALDYTCASALERTAPLVVSTARSQHLLLA
jgi:hypothetical protein